MKPMILRWQRTMIRNKPCAICGKSTSMEYSQTQQCDPDQFTHWEPRCFSHTPLKLLESAQEND